MYPYVESVECYLLLYSLDDLSHSEILEKVTPLSAILNELDHPIDVVQTMFGGIKMYLEWRFAEAGAYLRDALAINPNCLLAHFRYSDFLTLSGRFSEALEELNKIMVLDPLSPLTYKRIGRMFWKTGKYENAMLYLEDALELEPDDYEVLILMGAALTGLGRYDEALGVFRKSLEIQQNIEAVAMIGYVNALEGREVEALDIIRDIKSKSTNDRNRHAIKLARIYIALGERELAYKYLEEAFNRHESDLRALTFDPRYLQISHEPRFIELTSRVGLPSINQSSTLDSDSCSPSFAIKGTRYSVSFASARIGNM